MTSGTYDPLWLISRLNTEYVGEFLSRVHVDTWNLIWTFQGPWKAWNLILILKIFEIDTSYFFGADVVSFYISKLVESFLC